MSLSYYQQHVFHAETIFSTLSNNLENSGSFFISEKDFFENRINYKVRSGDDINKQVKDLYNKYSRLELEENTNSNSNTSVNKIGE